MGALGRFLDWLNGDVVAEYSPAPAEPAAPDRLTARLAEISAARLDEITVTRDVAMRDPVVNRARDLICGTVAGLPLRRVRTRGGRTEDLGPGWLARPDPTRTRGWFTSWITDDLFFHATAVARVTARDAEGYPLACEWMPWVELRWPPNDPDVVAWWPGSSSGPWATRPAASSGPVTVAVWDLIVWESPVSGLLAHGGEALATSRRLATSARRFAANRIAAGWFAQRDNVEDLDDAEVLAMLDQWEARRDTNATGYVNRALEWHESGMDPSRLQLVEGRGFQDAAIARLCNVPNFAVGVAVPGDSMTYKTAATARLDLIDFGIGPFLTCWEQTLSGPEVTPAGTSVVIDLDPFLRSGMLDPTTPAAPAPTPEAVP